MARRTWLTGLLVLALAGCVQIEGPRINGADAGAAPGPLERVMKRSFAIANFQLESGRALPERTVAFAHAARLQQLAEAWARQFDPNSMIALRKAS
ncbi:MAG: hypothetical protein HYV94_11420, partial [Candidatus Rokubacteria bacterium]|nr:hypothetical protein [Candidatus Rokubacteria bacterium]